MPSLCKSIGCSRRAEAGSDFCLPCLTKDGESEHSTQYPDNYRSVGDLTEIDAYGVNHLFQIQDPSGCLQHAIGKLLMTSTPQTTAYRAVREARDALTRWMQLNQEKAHEERRAK